MVVEFEDYDIALRSMRENYMPASEWMDHVSKIESTSFYQYEFSDTIREQFKDMYVLPYPYKNRYIDAYYAHMEDYGRSRSEFGQEDIDACKLVINERMATYLSNAIHTDIITFIDSNYDYGVVLHSITGKWFPFQYSETVGPQFVVGSAAGIINANKELFEQKLDLSNPKVVKRLKMAYNGKYFMSYTFQYKSEDGDIFYDPGEFGDVTEYISFTRKDVKSTMEYMDEMYADHAKCIVVT